MVEGGESSGNEDWDEDEDEAKDGWDEESDE